ncbi:hypothetical protein [Amycolatopsis taiwanensis]|uniref:VG15 protein n=1 Tax=Amycolatopsis taiwanensis TaxID=342230 RepID=UPI0004BCEDCA|nr:hypothetical protein [Amycolatopsis taiwanensis]
MTAPTAERTEIAYDHQDATQAAVRRAADDVQQAWREVAPDQLTAAYPSEILPVFISAVTAGQIYVAALAEPFVDKAVSGTDESAVASVLPVSFGGVTAGGMSLDWLGTALRVWLLQNLLAGMSTTDAHQAGLRRALTYVSTEINDAGRSAVQVAETAHPGVAGHERVVRLPACDRCIVLAGKFYRYSTGFLRHPRCDCTMVPVTRADWRAGRPENDPTALFHAMSEAEQNRRFGTANAEVIRMGGDISQVVNARSGMATVKAFGRNLQITTTGTTTRAFYGGYEIRPDGSLRPRTDAELRKEPGRRYRTTKAPRLTPGEIFRLGDEFGWDRDELVRQLRRYAYLTR